MLPSSGFLLAPRAGGLRERGCLLSNPYFMSKLRTATKEWLNQFDHVPASVIEKMAQADEYMSCYDSDSLRLIASPRIECNWCCATYEGQRTLNALRELEQEGQGEPCPFCETNRGDHWTMGYPIHAFPCGWGTLFAPRERLDREWILKHAQEVAQLGLFVFESEDYGCLLGIDGAGYNFYEAFWIPLYELRGLQWHA